jgi:hypothetical protein
MPKNRSRKSHAWAPLIKEIESCWDLQFFANFVESPKAASAFHEGNLKTAGTESFSQISS